MNLFSRTWVYRIISLLLAIGLFTYVNLGRLSTTRSSQQPNQQVLATKSQSIKVPLQLQTNSDKYFITGYPERVTVHLEGTSALVTTTVNTQNFKIVADLRQLGVGKHRVKLEQQGLNKELTYRIDPSYITVNIQPKETEKFPIQLQFNKSSVAAGYQVGAAKLSQETVQATGSRSDISRINQVVANVGVSNNRKMSIDQEVLLQALDESGKTVNVVLEPQTIHVNIPIYLPSKKVDLSFIQSGAAQKGLKYEFSSNTSEVEISGSQTTITKVKQLTIPVDVTGISETTNKNISINLKGTNLQAVSPPSVLVKITVTKSSNSSNSSSSETSDNTNGQGAVSSGSVQTAAEATSQSSSSNQNTSSVSSHAVSNSSKSEQSKSESES